MFSSFYVQCPACEMLVHDPALKLAAVDEPAPCCGAHGTSRGLWPGLQAVKLLEISQQQNREEPQGHRIALLFFASALEVMLEDVLVDLLRQHTESEELREAVLDSHQGVERRRALFARLSGNPLGDLLKGDWGQQFLKDWSTLAQQRNKVAHGSYYYRGSEDMPLLDRMSASYLRAFVAMHNFVVRRARRPGEVM